MNEEIIEEIRQVNKMYPDGINRKSRAKEMFEKLGFYEDKNHFSTMATIVYRDKRHNYSIYFDNDKTIDVECSISFELLRAINQQVKELGWYE